MYLGAANVDEYFPYARSIIKLRDFASALAALTAAAPTTLEYPSRFSPTRQASASGEKRVPCRAAPSPAAPSVSDRARMSRPLTKAHCGMRSLSLAHACVRAHARSMHSARRGAGPAGPLRKAAQCVALYVFGWGVSDAAVARRALHGSLQVCTRLPRTCTSRWGPSRLGPFPAWGHSRLAYSSLGSRPLRCARACRVPAVPRPRAERVRPPARPPHCGLHG